MALAGWVGPIPAWRWPGPIPAGSNATPRLGTASPDDTSSETAETIFYHETTLEPLPKRARIASPDDASPTQPPQPKRAPKACRSTFNKSRPKIAFIGPLKPPEMLGEFWDEPPETPTVTSAYESESDVASWHTDVAPEDWKPNPPGYCHPESPESAEHISSHSSRSNDDIILGIQQLLLHRALRRCLRSLESIDTELERGREEETYVASLDRWRA